MNIYINNQKAVIKKGSSFQYISENRYFTGSDSYTLDMTFPLRGCLENLAIFGNINRKDISTRQIMLDCRIEDTYFFISGIITITEISETQVKCQFLEGRSVQNYDESLDDIYINELNLGAPATNKASEYSCLLATRGTNGGKMLDYLALPWSNNTSGNLQNKMVWDYTNGRYAWTTEQSNGYLSFQPFLIFLFKKIFSVLGYTVSVPEWENSNWKYLLVCNAVPAAWELWNWENALPAWTVNEFLDEIEKLMNCSFNVDSSLKTVSMAMNAEGMSTEGLTDLSGMTEDFTIEVTEEDESGYENARGKKYSDCSHEMWALYTYNKDSNLLSNAGVDYTSSSGFDKDIKQLRSVDSFDVDSESYVNDKVFVDSETGELLMSKTALVEEQKPSSSSKIYSIQLKPIVAGTFREKEAQNGGETDELKIVPVWIDDVIINTENYAGNKTDQFNDIIVIECGELDNYVQDDKTENRAVDVIEQGEKKKDAHFDKLYVGFYMGDTYTKFKTDYGNVSLPHPIISKWTPILGDIATHASTGDYAPARMIESDVSLMLDGKGMRDPLSVNIKTTEKYTFHFISQGIPNVRSIFVIDGKKFLCKKITATIKESGMSQLLEGEFYRVAES